MTWSPDECAPEFSEQDLSDYLDNIAGRLGALRIFFLDRQTTQLKFSMGEGDCRVEEECLTIRTPIWNLIMSGGEDPAPIKTRLTPLG